MTAIIVRPAAVNICGKWFDVRPIQLPFSHEGIGLLYSPRLIVRYAPLDLASAKWLMDRLAEGVSFDTAYRHGDGEMYDVLAYVVRVEHEFSQNDEARMTFELVLMPPRDFVEQIGDAR
jgi:hypothetical protein